MKKYNIAAKKKLGQNFLTDNHVINKILNAAKIEKNELVIEIGSGLGVITELLAKRAGKCIAIEIDKALFEFLNETLAEYKNLEIINDDALKTDFGRLIADSGYKSAKVVGNLPYYITTPIIMRILESGAPISSATFMVQKEVAERIRAEHSTKDYGSLSLAVRYYADVSLVANVPCNCFIPRPTVDSAVINLEMRKAPPVEVQSEAAFFKTIRAAFRQRRKMLVNCIYNYEGFDFTKEQISDALVSLGINEKIRGENLEMEQFALISDRLCNLLES